MAPGNSTSYFDDLTPEELNPPAGPLTAQEAKANAAALASVICSYSDADAVHLQDRHWPVVMAKRTELGRPLQAAELRSIVDADRGCDGHN